MNRFIFVFLLGLLGTLVSQAIQLESKNQYETIHSLTYNDVVLTEVNAFFEGDTWLDNRLGSKMIDLNKVYQEKAFSRKLSSNSSVKRYQRSYGTWIEERICFESPYIDKPVRTKISSFFGRRLHPITGRSHVHAGIDFRGDTGTPVLAASNGIIKSTKRKGAYGKTIVIDHGNSYSTLYAHLSGYAVKEGQWVNLGQTIGYIGRTGRATGAHLHFEVRCHNVPMNPRKYLGKIGQVAEVKFKRYRSRRSWASHNHRHDHGHSHRRHSNKKVVIKDPNYYTRMINLQKLKKLKQKPVRF